MLGSNEQENNVNQISLTSLFTCKHGGEADLRQAGDAARLYLHYYTRTLPDSAEPQLMCMDLGRNMHFRLIHPLSHPVILPHLHAFLS